MSGRLPLLAAVGLAAGVGAAARYLLDAAVARRRDPTLPWGTAAVNLTGSFALGLLTAVAGRHALPSTTATILGAGLLGGYTTWSTYMWESLALAEAGAWRPAVINVAGSLAGGVAAAAAGLALGGLL